MEDLRDGVLVGQNSKFLFFGVLILVNLLVFLANRAEQLY